MTIYAKPPVVPEWSELATGAGDLVQPSNAQIQAGWPLSSTPPSRQWMNWLFSFCTGAIRYFCQRGLADYDPTETYQTNARIIGDDGNTYVSIQNANIGNTPSTSPLWWTRWGFTLAQISASVVSLTGFAASLVFPGYIKFPTALGGLIVQWSSGSPAASTINVPFPLNFPAACLAVFGATKTGTQTFSVDISGNNWVLTGNGTYWLLAIGH